MLGNGASADFFQNQLFLKKSFKNTIRVSNSLDPDQAQQRSWSKLSAKVMRQAENYSVSQFLNSLPVFVVF